MSRTSDGTVVYPDSGTAIWLDDKTIVEPAKHHQFFPYDPNYFPFKWDTYKENEMSKEKGTRSIYTAWIVDPEGDGEIVAKVDDVIAESFESAKMQAIKLHGGSLKKHIDDYDYVIRDNADWGSIRPKS